MIKGYKKLVLLLIGFFFIAPAGFGISSFPGLLSLDLPKIIPFILFIIIIFKFDFSKVDKITLLFLILIFFHFLSLFYSSSIKSSLVNFFSSLFLFYPGFFISYIIVNSENQIKNFIKIINIAFVLLISFSITEFLFQVNFFDFFRNSYIDKDTRFNNELGLIRLGYKASMGPFATTTTFGYTLTCLYFLKDLYKPKFFINRTKIFILQICGFIAIVFTLSRAAMLVALFFIIVKNIFNNKIRDVLIFILLTLGSFLFIFNKITNTNYENYLNNYVFNILSDDNQGVGLRFSNNTIDFNFALESPIIGHGAGMLYYNKINGVKLISSDSAYFMTLFAERGFISLLILAIILIITIKRAINLIKIKSTVFNYRSLLFALFSIIICINISQRQEVLFLFFLVIGLINKLYIINRKTYVDFYNNTDLQ